MGLMFIEVIAAKILIGFAPVDHVIYGNQYGMDMTQNSSKSNILLGPVLWG